MVVAVASTDDGLVRDGERRTGVSDLFLRCPAICCGSDRCSNGGEPDMGGEGKEDQRSVGVGVPEPSFSENREGSLSNLFLEKEAGMGGIPGKSSDFMSVAN